MGPSWLGGQILASLALGLDDEWTALPLAARRVVPNLPPEPLKRIGGGLRPSSSARSQARIAERRLERDEL